MEATDCLPDGNKQIIRSSRIPPPFREYLLDSPLHCQPWHLYNRKETVIEATKSKRIITIILCGVLCAHSVCPYSTDNQ